ncbi:hypothetical protein OIU79_010060, partial [Salix purpurea]
MEGPFFLFQFCIFCLKLYYVHAVPIVGFLKKQTLMFQSFNFTLSIYIFALIFALS